MKIVERLIIFEISETERSLDIFCAVCNLINNYIEARLLPKVVLDDLDYIGLFKA